MVGGVHPMSIQDERRSKEFYVGGNVHWVLVYLSINRFIGLLFISIPLASPFLQSHFYISPPDNHISKNISLLRGLRENRESMSE